jgi:peptidoglycan/LPS O-acetylase OafA/YrhL
MTKNNTYFKHLSDAITWLRFPLIFLIILLHCYSTVGLPSDHGLYFRILYPFSLWLGETGVPGFFFISGFLFFLSKKNYQQKLETRFHTLLIPYLLWNALLLGLYIFTYLAGYPQDINGKSIADYTFIDYIRAFWDRGSYDDGNFVPILCPFWYIRNLLMMSVLSPLFYYIIKYVRELFLMAVAIGWLMTPHNAFISQTILFFCLGAYFSILDKNPLEIFTKYKKTILLLCAITAFADIVVHTIYVTPVNLQIHRIALILNIPALFILADFCCQRNITSKLLPNAAFIVFSVHYPIVVVMRKACAAKLGDASDLIHIPLYFICVFLATAISIIIYMGMNKYMPKIKNILSGNR